VITLCDKSALECLALPGAGEYIAWDFEDPASSSQKDAYTQCLQQIHERIKMFVLSKRKASTPVQMLAPVTLFKCLADDTRARMTQLIVQEGELCVCELTAALQESQPKISRHLAMLRSAKVLLDRRQGQWVFYRLNPELPAWATETLEQTRAQNTELLTPLMQNLCAMGERPERAKACC